MSCEPHYLEATATFDDERIYRYHLVRRWAPGPMCLWIMLNPSTADEIKLDPTLRRCLGFTRSWTISDPPCDTCRNWTCGPGASSCPSCLRILDTRRRPLGIASFGAFEVCNLYALRSPKPKVLWKHRDPVGPNNDAAIQSAAKRAGLVIVGWGQNAKPERERHVAQLLADAGVQPYALKITKGGHPGHPLYLPDDTKPVRWHARGLR